MQMLAKVYPNLYNAAQSGFTASFNIDQIKAALKAGHHLQIVDRYTTDPYGNRNSIDFWSNPQNL